MPLSSGFSVPTPQLSVPPPAASVLVTSTAVAESVEKPTNTLTARDLALYVGVPVATLCVAGGLYYYFTKSSDKDSDENSKKPVTEEEAVAVVEPTTEDTTGAGLEEEDTRSPLEKAQGSKGKGNKYFKAGRFQQAIDCYSKALEECPDDQLSEIATFYQNRAAAHEKMKNWTEVIADTTNAIKLNPKYTKALARRAKANEVLDDKRSALEDITAVCLIEGFSNQEHMMLADRVMKTLGKTLAEDYYAKRPRVLPSATFVKSYLDSFNENIFVVEVSEEDAPNTKYVEISNFMKTKNYDNVVTLCTAEIDSNGPYKNLSLLLRGTMYTLMNEIEKGMADFNMVVELEDTDDNKKMKVDALIKRGSLKMQLAQDKACYADFDKGFELDPNNANLYHHRGQLYFLTERLQESRAEFEKSIMLDPNFVAPRLQLGYAISKIGMQSMSPLMMSEANKVLEDTTTKFPDCPEAWSLHGQLLQEQQQLNLAEEKLDKSIALAPENPTTYVYKGLLMLQWKQDLEAATKLIREAIRLDDKCDLAYETLATLEVQRGNAEEAIKLFERALDLVRTESDLANTFTLLEASKAQTKVMKEYGITLPRMQGM